MSQSQMTEINFPLPFLTKKLRLAYLLIIQVLHLFLTKLGLVRTLLHRAFTISSSWFLFHEEVVRIKHYLEKNSYPLSFVNKQVKFFLENKINDKSDTVNATNNIVKYYKLPYISHISTDVKIRLIGCVDFIVKI